MREEHFKKDGQPVYCASLRRHVACCRRAQRTRPYEGPEQLFSLTLLLDNAQQDTRMWKTHRDNVEIQRRPFLFHRNTRDE